MNRNINYEKTSLVRKVVRIVVFFTLANRNLSAINSLNPQIDHDNIHSNHLKHSPRSMSSFLSKFFSICYRHSYVPNELVKGVLLPLTKDIHGDRESSNNYRPIISSSVFLKTLEYAIKFKIEHLLCTNERQFGFKSHSSTQYATLVLKEVINTYTTQNSNVYLVKSNSIIVI
jgi:hypothetical protein